MRTLTITDKNNLIKSSNISQSILESSEVFSNDFSDSYFNEEGIMFPYFCLEGRLLGYRMRYTQKIIDKNGKEQRYTQKKGQEVKCYFLKEDIPKIININQPLLITEGEKKLLSLKSITEFEEFAACSYPGCWGWSKDKELAPIWDTIQIKDREIILIPDSDFFINFNVYIAIITFIKHLTSKGAIVKLINLRGEKNQEKLGVDDFRLKFGNEKLKNRISKAFWTFCDTGEDSYKSNKFNIVVESLVILSRNERRKTLRYLRKLDMNFKEDNFEDDFLAILKEWNYKRPYQIEEGLLDFVLKEDSNDEIIKKLNKEIKKVPCIYRNSSFYSFVVVSPKTKYCIYSNSKQVSDLFSNFITYTEFTRDKEGEKVPKRKMMLPEKVAATFMKRGENYDKIKKIEYSSPFPVAHNNRIIIKPGYDIEAQVYYEGNTVSLVNDFSYLDKILYSFPFETTIDRENFLGYLLSLFFVNDFRHEMPCLIITGDEPDLGKTTLMIILGIIFENTKHISFADIVEENELKKVICSLLMNSSLIVFDNLKKRGGYGNVTSSFLERLVTSPIIKERILGGNNVFERINNFIIAFTLNNGSFSDDILTRSLLISLSSKSEIKINTKFDVVQFTLDHRDKIINELYSLLSKSMAKGDVSDRFEMPTSKFKFSRWGRKLGDILLSLGWKSFLSNQDTLKSSSDSFVIELEKIIIESNLFLRPVSASKLMELLPHELFEGMSTPSRIVSYIGKKMTSLDQKIIGFDKSIKVKKVTSGNNAQYCFEKSIRETRE